MSVDLNDLAAVQKRFWGELEQSRFGMLSADGMYGRHFNPMTVFAEPETHKVWFYTRSNSELAECAAAGVAATLIVVAKDQSLQASVIGRLTAKLDVLHRDKYWNSVVAAWFKGGKNDPALTMLCLDCQEAEVWISDQNGLRFGWEITKANLTGAEPHVGGRAVIQFH
jgi:general stress protein 26